MKYSRIILGIFTVIVCVVMLQRVAQQVAHAQESSPEFTAAKEQYLNFLQDYRTKEDQFVIAREQYLQVQTLASLEETVKASKAVQVVRIDTLHAYFETLLLYISQLHGVEVTRKAAQQNLLRQMMLDLATLGKQLSSATDRVSLDNLSKLLEDRQKLYTAASASTLSLAKIASMQSATDQLGILSTQVFDSIQTASPEATVFAEKQRGYDELNRTITEIKEVLAASTKQFDNYTSGGEFSLNSYVQITDTLNSGYTKLNQSENFLKELAK